jgi:hypothetical protein
MKDKPFDTRRHGERTARIVRCVECDRSSGLRWKGWVAYRCDDPESAAPATITFYCPTCAENEFGHSRRV